MQGSADSGKRLSLDLTYKELKHLINKYILPDPLPGLDLTYKELKPKRKFAWDVFKDV